MAALLLDFLKATDASDRIGEYAALAKDFISINGGLLRTNHHPDSSDFARHVPFLLMPTAFPRQRFEIVWNLQPEFNLLFHRMALDCQFLQSSLDVAIKTDKFANLLWSLYEDVYLKEFSRCRSRIYLGTVRNDYMLHKTFASSNVEIKMVEYNMIAVGNGWLQQIVNKWHSHLLSEFVENEQFMMASSFKEQMHQNIEGNRPGIEKAHLLSVALAEYNKMYELTQGSTYLLIVVESVARNIFDQRHMEFGLRQLGVKTIRRTFSQLRIAIDREEVERSGRLILEADKEVGVVYYRTGYNETDYDFEAGDWELVRIPIERSRAAKAPCVAHQLVNYKKIQQVMTGPGILERFGIPSEISSQMRSTFAETLGLEFNEAGEKAVSMALLRPHDYVLKPQQEGGGHNFFGEDVAKVVTQLRNAPERPNYVLMSKIDSPSEPNVSVAAGEPIEKPSIGNFSAEMGIYGGFVISDGHVVFNKALGYLLRAKPDGVNEGGVTAGYGRIASAFFV